MRRTCRFVLLGALAALFLAVSVIAADWPQWGGPSRDFVIAGAETVPGWVEGVPPELWRRPLGPGYSAIVSAGERLFTMTRRGDEELVVALAAGTGETLWEHSYTAPVPSGPTVDTTWGAGPNSAPLVVDGRLYTLGFTAILSCLDAASGAILWRHDLAAQVGSAAPYFGHSASPIRYDDLVIVPAAGALAFRLDSGEPVWQSSDFETTYASPVLWPLAERPLLVVPAAGEIVGLDPTDGQLLWRHPHAPST